MTTIHIRLKWLMNTVCLVLLTGCSGFYYHPMEEHWVDPKRGQANDYENIWLDVSEEVRLHGWWIKGHNPEQQPKQLVLQLHGNAQNISTHMWSLLWLAQLEFDLLTIDYRGYGKSTGTPTPLGLREDAQAMLAYAVQHFKQGGYQQLIVIGQSLGGAVVLDALAHSDTSLQEQIDWLVLDSTFASYKRVGASVLRQHWLTYLFSPLSYVIASNKTGPGRSSLCHLNMPKLWIHAKVDPVIPFAEGQRLREQLPPPLISWELDTPSHIGVFGIEEKRYQNEFLRLMRQPAPERSVPAQPCPLN